MSPAFHASKPARTTSTFSCDIAYSERPAASRASARSRKLSRWITLLHARSRREVMEDGRTPCCPTRAGTRRASTLSPAPTISSASIVKSCQGSSSARLTRRPLRCRNASRRRGIPVPAPRRRRDRAGRRGRVQVALIPPLVDRSHDLDVLLRHRPRSIPQAQESA